ncbi:MAG: RodZ domain-containing protein [Chloroflexota bacterium]
MDPTALGRYLRESREAKEITLEDAVRALRIRRDILEAFEQGEFKVMDSTVRVRGMLRNYAHYLGLEEDRVLQYYESASTWTRKRRFSRREKHVELNAPSKITDTPPALPVVDVKTSTSPDTTARLANIMRIVALVLFSIAAIAVIAYVTIDLLGVDIRQPMVTETATLAPDMSVTPTNTSTITPRATVLTDTPAPALGITGIQIDVEITQRSWVSITVDEREQFTGFLEPGYRSSFTGNESIIFRAANAAALDIVYNGIQQETFGARGQEVEVVFSVTGVDVMQSTLVPVLASDTPTVMPNAVESDASIEPTTVPIGNQPTMIPTQAPPSPTPLFALNQSSEETTSSNTADATSPPNEAQSTSNATTQPTQAESPQNPTEPATTPTPEPTEAGSNLPVRSTPNNPTPTKTG